jgi:tetratricopeptide (TPR) repeat protein
MNEFGYYYDGKFISQPNAKAVYVAVFKLFGDLDPAFYTRFYESNHNRGIIRTYLSRDINELYPNRSDLVKLPTEELPDEWKLGTNLSNLDKEKIIRRACEVANITYSGRVFYVVLGDGVTGEFLDGQFRLRIIDIHNDRGNNVTRYIAENVHTGEIVSVKFRNRDKQPERYIGWIGDFDGNDNDIQTNPRGNIRTGRQGATFGNPFDPYSYAGMSEALESIDNLHRVRASDVGPGNYWCYNCYEKVHWRQIEGRANHFYHWRRNPECELSSKEDKPWSYDIQELENRFKINYQERWIETINDLIEGNNLYLLEGQSWAKNPIELYLQYLNSKTDSETYSDIIFDIKEVLSLIPDTPHGEPVTKTTADYHRGLNSYKMENYENAIKCFTQVITINPQYADAYYYRGHAHYDMNNYDFAIEDFTQVITINPQYVDAHYYRGCAHYDMNNYDFAIKDFTRAIEIDPQYAAAYYYRGRAYYDMWNYILAIKDFTWTITIDPDYAAAYYYRGCLYYNINNYTLAIEDFMQAGHMKNYENAIECFTRAISIKPQDSAGYYNRGRVHYSMKNYSLAIEDFTQMIKIYPQYAGTYYYRGRAYYDMANYDLANADFSQAVTLDQSYEELIQNIRTK